MGLVVSWVGWLLVLVRRSVSHLDDQSISEFGGWLVGELGRLVGWLVSWMNGWRVSGRLVGLFW